MSFPLWPSTKWKVYLGDVADALWRVHFPLTLCVLSLNSKYNFEHKCNLFTCLPLWWRVKFRGISVVVRALVRWLLCLTPPSEVWHFWLLLWPLWPFPPLIEKGNLLLVYNIICGSAMFTSQQHALNRHGTKLFFFCSVLTWTESVKCVSFTGKCEQQPWVTGNIFHPGSTLHSIPELDKW